MKPEIDWVEIFSRHTQAELTDRPELQEIAERGHYRLAPMGHSIQGLIPTDRTPIPRARLRDATEFFAADEEELSLPPQVRVHPSNRTRFLGRADCELLGFAAFADEVGKQYEQFRKAYLPNGNLVPGALTDLSTLRAEAQKYLGLAAKNVTYTIEKLALPFLLVLFWETFRAVDTEPNLEWDELPEPKRQRLLHVEQFFRNRVWNKSLVCAPEAELWGEGFSELRIHFPELSSALLDFQMPILREHLRQRDEIAIEILPIEFRRIACELILSKVVRDAPVARWSEKDAEPLLPLREDFRCQSRRALRDIFDLFDLLHVEEHSKRKWSHHNQFYKALAKRNAEEKPSDISMERFISNETDRLRKAVSRTLEYRQEEDVLCGTSNEQIAKQLRDWLLTVGHSHRPNWRDGEGNS